MISQITPGQRIVIVGSTSSGKTTLAGQLSRILKLPHIELDALHWDANWTPAESGEFRRRVSDALAGESWVADGNYSQVRDIVWTRADTLVWLDYSLPTILLRLTRRTLVRTLRGDELYAGNRERLTEVFSKDSLYLWALQTHARRRREYPEQLALPEYVHLRTLRFRTPRETEAWWRRIVREIPQLGEPKTPPGTDDESDTGP